MTREEAQRILAVFGAAYPNQFKYLDNASVELMAKLWAQQFALVPYDIMTFAVSQEIAENKFAPTIAEIKRRISDLYKDAKVIELEVAKGLKVITRTEAEKVDYILKACNPDAIEPSLLGIHTQQCIGGQTT